MNEFELAVEDVSAGDAIFVTPRIGWRPVIDVEQYPTLGLEQVDCFVVLYQPAGSGMAWENRGGAKNVVSWFSRDAVGLAPCRRGELVRIRRERALRVVA